MAVSPSGRLYVESYQMYIAIFAAGANGNVVPVREIGGKVVVSLAPDRLGRLYGLDSNGSILTFGANANGDPAPLAAFKVSGATGGEADASIPSAWAIAVR
jgi:hypothetical protein